jgi:hypothetical protein
MDRFFVKEIDRVFFCAGFPGQDASGEIVSLAELRTTVPVIL